VLDRGIPVSMREQREDRPRYAVVEHDDLGPIMRAGPYRILRLAVEACQAMNFRSEMGEERDHASQK
jgi:hypothetical protein